MIIQYVEPSCLLTLYIFDNTWGLLVL